MQYLLSAIYLQLQKRDVKAPPIVFLSSMSPSYTEVVRRAFDDKFYILRCLGVHREEKSVPFGAFLLGHEKSAVYERPTLIPALLLFF